MRPQAETHLLGGGSAVPTCVPVPPHASRWSPSPTPRTFLTEGVRNSAQEIRY